MAAERKRSVRCAVYTRKSSEEGLEQSFNSLDAQREACLAYIESQRHEGWRGLPDLYDDGGFSGGNMERPALKTLMQDIDAGKVDSVVVYKVDRLTRSLPDFAKIVEVFDAKGVSFVSVTQHFNTTSSMGRLTLNVLLSFAQFEREVTGERIRDKIAASKRKGMWMGGFVPLGYDLKDRKLLANSTEADLVRQIFTRYLELKSVARLKAELDAKGVRNKQRVNASGKAYSGGILSRGTLYHLLNNRIYIGEIQHKGQSHPGEHEAIVSRELWDQVHALLAENVVEKQVRSQATEASLLAGLIFDDRGNRLTPSHAVKNGRRYRYYVSQAVIHHRHGQIGTARRIPAKDMEDVVIRRLKLLLESAHEALATLTTQSDAPESKRHLVLAAQQCAQHWSGMKPADLRSYLCAAVSKIVVNNASIDIHVNRDGLYANLTGSRRKDVDEPSEADYADHDEAVISLGAEFRRVRGEMRVVLPPDSPLTSAPTPNAALIKVIARGYAWYEMVTSGEIASMTELAKKVGIHLSYVSRVVKAGLLAPDLLQMVLEGRQPAALTVEHLLEELPATWVKQREFFGALGGTTR